jgi:hypothetical protein
MIMAKSWPLTSNEKLYINVAQQHEVNLFISTRTQDSQTLLLCVLLGTCASVSSRRQSKDENE